MKELIIDKNTRLSKIKDKETYTKLILKTKVNPKSLKDFKNIKEVDIYRYKSIYNIKGFNVYNEKHINELPFKDNIEKLTFFNIENFGIDESYNKTYRLYLHNLKSIEFVGSVVVLNTFYLNSCEKLENITFNSSEIITDFELHLNSPLKKVYVINNNKKYEIPMLYKPHTCTLKHSINYLLEYKNKTFISDVKLENETINQETSIKSIHDDLILDETIFIPDFIDKSFINNVYNLKKHDAVSFNLNLLKTQNKKTNLLGIYNLQPLKKIILRSNNEMSLFPNNEIIINDKLKELYIENNKLHIVYPKKTILVDEFGKETTQSSITNNLEIEELFNKYNLEEKEEYIYYKKLLELIKKYNDDDLDNMINKLGDRIIKKLTK